MTFPSCWSCNYGSYMKLPMLTIVIYNYIQVIQDHPVVSIYSVYSRSNVSSRFQSFWSLYSAHFARRFRAKTEGRLGERSWSHGPDAQESQGNRGERCLKHWKPLYLMVTTMIKTPSLSVKIFPWTILNQSNDWNTMLRTTILSSAWDERMMVPLLHWALVSIHLSLQSRLRICWLLAVTHCQNIIISQEIDILYHSLECYYSVWI